MKYKLKVCNILQTREQIIIRELGAHSFLLLVYFLHVHFCYVLVLIVRAYKYETVCACSFTNININEKELISTPNTFLYIL